MKRLIFIASLAMLAVGCQKTEIQNEVLTPIGFSTEVGKQTRAIVQDGTYLTDQPFGVYAYGHQGNDITPVMDNVEVSYTAAVDADENTNPPTVATPEKWGVTTNNNITTKYYWPNDPRTIMNFYAYSPAKPKTGVDSQKAAHQELTGEITHDENDGLTLTDYLHSNMYVDFMVATPVLGATYSDQDGTEGTAEDLTSVPLSFGHKMTQVNFTVKIADNADYPNVDFTINSIVLNNIKSQGTFTYKYNPAVDQTPESVTEAWAFDQTPVTSSYQIYPATTAGATSATDYSAGAPALTNVDAEETTEQTVILRTDPTGTRDDQQLTVNAANPGKSFSTTPVTMIPQSLTNDDAQTDVDQSFTISYTISGTGVATETIVRTFDFADATANPVPTWGINQKITYTLTISLHEITFSPSVTTWDESTGDYVDPAI